MGTPQRRVATGTAVLVLMCMVIDAAPAAQEDVATAILSLDRQFWHAYPQRQDSCRSLGLLTSGARRRRLSDEAVLSGI